MDVASDVEQLKARFTTATHVDYHLDSNGKIAPCCMAAILTLESSLIASSLHCGLSGVLDYLQSKFRWGLVQETYFSDCMAADELACGPSTAMACWSLEFYRDQICPSLSNTDHNYSAISIQIIEQCSIGNAALWRSKIGKKKGQCAEWIRDTCNYHECVGLIDNVTRELSVWDFGVWKRLHTLSESEGAIFCVRLDTRCKGNPSKVSEYESLIASTVLWEGHVMEFEKWIDLPHDNTVNSLSLELQSSFIADVYSPKKPLGDALTVSPVIYISGAEMGPNPCAGVGVARSVRLCYPNAILIVVDDGGGSAAGGMCDPVFDDAISIALMSVAKKSKREKDDCHGDKFTTVFDLLVKDRNAFFLPCRDSDVTAMADGIAILTSKAENVDEEHEYDIILSTHDEDDILSICDRILCPPQCSIALSDKPDIMCKSTSALKGFFKIPEFFLLEPERGSWVEVQAFAERVGYPVVTKGASQGCLVCLNWIVLSHSLNSLLSEGGFVQKLVYGTDITIAFAGFQGECSGCVCMTKESYTCVGKVWDGRITPLSPVLTRAIEEFVQDSNWTGGGELEMVQDLSGDLWAIDLNIRFPAWIFSTAYSGFNLPGNMIEHAVYAREYKVLGARSKQSYISSPYVMYVPFLSLPGKRESMTNASAAFTRSIVEIPRKNVTIERSIRLPYCSLSNHTPQNKGGSSTVKQKNNKPLPLLPAATVAALSAVTLSADTGCDDTNNLASRNKVIALPESAQSSPQKHTETTRAIASAARCMSRDILALSTAASDFLLKGPLITPHRILCIATVTESLQRHQMMLQSASNIVNSSRANDGDSITLQMCLSVKTQPHRAVLAAAKTAQYCAECISLAEVYAAIDAGFPVEEIVLTGPGKFYDIMPEGERTLKGPLRAIFADSLSDLKEIVARVLDPCDWLDCATIGVRWMPAWHVRSRFGLDPKDMKLVLAVAEIISALPADKGVGMHFHFASSTLGADIWFGLAKAFCHFSAGFVSLIHRPITAIDFGGGWSPYFYVEGSEEGVLESTNKKLSSILQSVCTEFEAVQSTLPSVQFEPGKCISEAAGGIITRILSIREVPHEGRASDSPEAEDMEEDKENQLGRAFIVDTCIAEISSPHIHPVFWKSKNLKSDSTVDVWLPLPPGDDVIWGRTCMEFDIIHGSFSLPSTAQPGDFLLYAATGSYDFTNSYDFGDGIARSMTLL